ncbi:helix-turn-helix transcriptional regulator [Streptomyces sp. NPDC004539]|uniref:helix-turn-helix domain-containing protein n=1 Tax=Streptomyces sp. NPDC004539 TaxID=3154280 RepID=UPI0033A97842
MPARRTVTGRSGGPRERFAEELKRAREQKGVSLRKLADDVGWNQSLLSRMENGILLGGPDVVRDLDFYYGTGDKLLILWELAVADKNQYRAEYRPYMQIEEKALALWQYSPTTLPGMLQTRAYMRESLAASGVFDEEELEQQVEARLRRRELLEPENGLLYRGVLSEAVLRNRLRDDPAWREQLLDLLEVSERPNVTLQVLPFDAGHHGLMNTSVVFLQLPGEKLVAYTENEVRGEVIEETSTVVALNHAYDAVRDLALSPAESRRFITRLLEELPCEPST